jgi:hypothetical protein
MVLILASSKIPALSFVAWRGRKPKQGSGFEGNPSVVDVALTGLLGQILPL